MERVQQEFFSMGNLAQLAELPESLLNPPASGAFNRIIFGDARAVLQKLPVDSVDLSFWSPPYYVGKSYERDLRFEDWQSLLASVIQAHQRILKPAGFLAINIGDILCFADPDMPRFQADNIQGKKHAVTRQDVEHMQRKFPKANRAASKLYSGGSMATMCAAASRLPRPRFS